MDNPLQKLDPRQGASGGMNALVQVNFTVNESVWLAARIAEWVAVEENKNTKTALEIMRARILHAAGRLS